MFFKVLCHNSVLISLECSNILLRCLQMWIDGQFIKSEVFHSDKGEGAYYITLIDVESGGMVNITSRRDYDMPRGIFHARFLVKPSVRSGGSYLRVLQVQMGAELEEVAKMVAPDSVVPEVR